MVRAWVVLPMQRLRQSAGSCLLRSEQQRLEEAVRLTLAVGVEIIEHQIVTLRRISPGALFGKGWLEDAASVIEEKEIELLVVHTMLSPIQQRNLERQLGIKVIDRTALILEIFGARARTHEGKIQVELAALTYQRTRLVRSWTHLERQRGGFGFLGGPGESQLEIDKRLIRNRINRLQKDLDALSRRRLLHRRARERTRWPMLALVGYTNAGKSTLFNRLTKSKQFTAPMLFATLDPAIQRVALPGYREFAFVSDTVGFIADLPTHLIAAFRATLEELQHADVILHVRDIFSHETDAQRDDVQAILADMDIPLHRVVEVWNKVDLLTPETRAALLGRTRETRAALVSASTGAGVADLLEMVVSVLRQFDIPEHLDESTPSTYDPID